MKPLSQRQGAKPGCLYGFFGLFAVFGLLFFVPFFALPAWRAIASRGWPAVPCTIVASSVGVHPSDEGDPTYSIDVVFEYEVDGQSYRSERYGFFSGGTSGQEGKQRVVDSLPPGTRTVCWVNPEEPTFAVLDRSLFPWVFFGCLPLAFVAVGAGGIAFVAAGAGKSRRARRAAVASGGRAFAGQAASGDAATTPGGHRRARAAVAELATEAKAPPGLAEAGLEPWAPHGPAVLEPAAKRLSKLVGLVLAAIVWNGLVGFFIFIVYRKGELFQIGCFGILLAVFALVGLLLLVSVPHQLLALRNPRPVIDLSGPLHPGARVSVGWRFQGAASRLRRLRIYLEGREHARYRRGTSTHTDKRTFATLQIVDTTDPMHITQGGAVLALPADTMHSFSATHNQVVWELHVKGEIRFWPDIDDAIELAVYPTEMV